MPEPEICSISSLIAENRKEVYLNYIILYRNHREIHVDFLLKGGINYDILEMQSMRICV